MSDESKNTDLQQKPYDDLVEAIKDKLEFYISSHVVTLFKATDESLFDAANSASSIDEQNRMFEFMNALRAKKEGIEKNFIRELNLFIRPISETRGVPKKKESFTEGDQLGLIDQDEMDEMVTLSSISSKAAGDFREELSHLEARLEHLALQNYSIFSPKALEPKNLCDAFKVAIANFDFDIKNKLIFYKLFSKELVFPLRELYQDLNELMIEAGILPQIDLSGKFKRSPLPQKQEAEGELFGDWPQTGNAAARSSDGIASGGATAGMSGAGGAASGTGSADMTGAGGVASGTGSAGMTGAGAAAGGAGSVTMPGTGGASAQTILGNSKNASVSADSANASEDGYTAGMPVSQVRESISNFVGGEPTRSDEGVSGGGAAGYYTHNDVVSALSSMQSAAPMLAPGAKLQFDAGAIKKAVLTSIGEKHGGVVDKRVNHVSEKTIDFIKLIFDAIIADTSITDTIKALLLSLQIPVIKAAMIDANFFVDDFHPARQLLDKLAEAGVGVSDHKDLIYIEIKKVIKKFLNDFDEDVAAFTLALEELDKLTAELATKAQQREAEAQRQLRHDHARYVVLQEIRKITLGHELPAGVHALVLKVWPSLMFNHYLQFGKANDEWIEMLMILDKIIDSVQPLANTVELAVLEMGYEDIIVAAENKLKISKRARAQLKEAMDGLRATYQELIQTPDLPDVEQVQEQPVREQVSLPKSQETLLPAEVVMETGVFEVEIGASTETEQPLTILQPLPEPEEKGTPEIIALRKVEALPEDVKPGAWFIVYNGDGKPVRRVKLAVILIQTATLVFVDHLGNIVIEKDAEDFAEELKQDLSGIIMQHSVFDHALNSALKTISK